MRQSIEEGPYLSCMDLQAGQLREILRYDPELGTLCWLGRMGRGGGIPGRHVRGTKITIHGERRNTFGVICLLHAGRLPARKIIFRDGQATNWRWGNIRPDGWS